MLGRLGIAGCLLLAACSNPTGPNDGGTDAGGGNCDIAACSGNDNSTCPSTTNYKCTGDCCVFFCRAVSDCANQLCAQSALGCVCDLGTCQQKVCSIDQDCGSGEVCKGGSCYSPDTSAASCVISPGLFVSHVGTGTQLTVIAFDADGGVVRPATAPQFVVSGAAGTVDSSGVFTATVPSSVPGDVTITAALAGASCNAQVTAYGPATSSQVTVIDGNTALPVTDATIQISASANGTLLGTAVVGGSALGVYPLSASTLATGGMLTVFDESYEFVSAVLPNVADAGTLDLVFVLAQTGKLDPVTNAPYVGGYIGDFSKAVGPFSSGGSATTSTVLLGVAGTAVPEDPASVSLSGLLGPSAKVTLGSIGQSFNLPVGVEVDYSTKPLNCAYEGLGPSGGCGLAVLDGGADPFTCAQRPAWGLGGAIPSENINSLLEGGTAPTISQLLSAAAPSFPSFASGVGFDVPYTLAPPVLSSTVPNSCDAAEPGSGTQPVPDPSNLTPFLLELDTPVDLVAAVSMPAMPQLGGDAGCIQNALVLGGVLDPQVGLLPLGLSAASTLDANGNADTTCLTYDPNNPTQADGQVSLHLAPAHGGLEGMTYGVLALAGIGASQNAVSGLLQTFTDLPYGTAVNFNGQPFLGLTTGTSYTSAARSFSLGAGLATAPTLYRLRFVQGSSNGQWAIQIPPGSGPVVLPVPPAPFTDRTTSASVSIEALQLGTSTPYSALVSFANGALELNLMQQIQAFSSIGVSIQ